MKEWQTVASAWPCGAEGTEETMNQGEEQFNTVWWRQLCPSHQTKTFSNIVASATCDHASKCKAVEFVCVCITSAPSFIRSGQPNSNYSEQEVLIGLRRWAKTIILFTVRGYSFATE
eukprot:scpid52984/ scgid8836/ 